VRHSGGDTLLSVSVGSPAACGNSCRAGQGDKRWRRPVVAPPVVVHRRWAAMIQDSTADQAYRYPNLDGDSGWAWVAA
jgi:hypothetical protein